ncbi:hypothetical protein [Hubei picorna-like virus 41]|uniref:hypothetical protein n=1 Tax=Hubei picorna-like virus 41 TaxID=1923122 RepID=UPI00090CD68D|nr:hypothetical protein [Hubei picorna-like virus 41]APG78007.1 hypothetical protein [Hubei picorna-like virus 41]
MNNVNDDSIHNNGRRGGDRGNRQLTSINTDGVKIEYPTKMACYKALISGLDKYPTTRGSSFNPHINYTADYNSWLMATGYMYTATTNKNWAKNDSRENYFETIRVLRWSTNEGLVEVIAHGGHSSLKIANNQSCFEVEQKVKQLIPKVQMMTEPTTESNQEDWTLYDSLDWIKWNLRQQRYIRKYQIPRVQNDDKVIESSQGKSNQSSDKQQNTIITQDQAETVSKHSGALDTVALLSSSEPPHKFESVTARWMPLDIITLSTDKKVGTLLKAYYLPESLYSDTCSPSLMPFSTFIYGRMDIELRLVVNSNKFACGKVVMSSKYDTYQADNLCSGLQSALVRNHVIVDLSANNEGVLQVPFRYHRPWVRLVKNDMASYGVRPAKYASIYLHCLAPLSTGKDGPSEVGARIFFRFKNTEFTGMSYKVAVQMPIGFEDVITPTTSRALKEVLIGAEKAFDQLGASRNQDKPSKLLANVVVPRPRLNFGGGKGVADVVPLRVNPHTLTNYHFVSCPTDEPKSFYELARIWGVYKQFDWKATHAEGTSLGEFIMDPTARSYTKDVIGESTPLEYACANYAFWSGPIELRFDFVSNAYHTGTIQISAEFGRKTAAANACESSSTYTKMFHLGEQRSVSFRVPYIYDTVYRRSTANYYQPYESQPTSDDIRSKSLVIAPESQTYIKIRVINALKPISSAPQSIVVNIFVRAGENFTMYGLKGVSMYPSRDVETMDSFPRDGYKLEDWPTIEKQEAAAKATGTANQTPLDKPGVTNTSRRRRSISGLEQLKIDLERQYLPAALRNEWNEYKPECLPRTQMDNGEKEDEDPTDNFSIGRPTWDVQTLDRQTDFKDLLRRPTLLFWKVSIDPTSTGANGGFFIPLMPPCRDMCATKEGKLNGDFATTLHQASATAIMDMFRCWRGGMRYTIVAYEAKHPFYVSLIPHSGTRIVGNHTVNTSGAHPICGANFTTEIVVPSINPTVTIEAPYETENIWTLTFDEKAARNYSWRDKGDTNAGHIVISTHEKIKVDVWWSAADDFEFSNFYGIPETKWNGWAYRHHDRHGRVQMDTDFSLTETVTKVTGLAKQSWKSGLLARSAIAAIPVVGQPLVLGDAVTRGVQRINEVADSATTTMGNINLAAEKIGVGVDQLLGVITNAVAGIGEKISGLIHGVSLLYDIFLDLIIAWMEKSWKVVGIAIVRFVTKVMSTSLDVGSIVMGYATQIANFINGVVEDQLPRTQIEENNNYIYVGLLAGMIGTLTGVTLNPTQWYSSWTRNLGLRLTSTAGIAYLVQIMNFMKMTFSTIQSMVMRALGYVSPEAVALKKLAEQSKEIDHFIREAQIITSEVNMSLLGQTQYRVRFWKTVLQAYQIQRLLAQVPANCASYQLSKACTDVIKIANEKFLDLSASPVRFVPMVIVLEGPAGTGKSHITESLVQHLLDRVGFKSVVSEKIYYRTAGERFWSGYRDQPVVVYDEWMNTTDSQRNIEQVAEMMKLKSCSTFIPEMAHLEEKKIRGNPLIIIMCCNNAFPNNLSDYVTCSEAILRRRDLVLRVERLPEYEKVNYRESSPEIQKVFDENKHLTIGRYKDVFNRNSLTSIRKDYETTKKWVGDQWKNYYQHEQREVQNRMKKLPHYFEKAQGEINIQDPFTLFYQIGVEMRVDAAEGNNVWTPYEELEVAVSAIVNAIKVPAVIPPEEPVELIPWELAQPPTTQSVWDWVLGLGFGGTIPAWIAKASLPQLLKWEYEINPLKTTLSDCSICLGQEIPCTYICTTTQDLEGEARHTLCYECYISLTKYGNGSCPKCRCTEIVPVIGVQDINVLSVWKQIMLRTNKSLQWLCQKILAYYDWRQNHYFQAILADHIMTVAMILITKGNTTVGPVLSLHRTLTSFYRMYNNWDLLYSVFTQSDDDDWGELERPITQAQNRSDDEFQVGINKDILNKWVTNRKETPLCMHHRVRQHIRSAQLIGDIWRIQDSTTRQCLEVSVYACKGTCKLFDEQPIEVWHDTYRQLIEQIMIMHKAQIRNAYIRYYNNPCEETLTNIDPIFRPEWIEAPVERLSRSWWEYLSDVWKDYRTMIIYGGAALTVIASIIGAYKMAGALIGTTLASSQQGATAGSPQRQARNPRRFIDRGNRRPVAYFNAENETPTQFEVAAGYVVRNTFKITIMIGTKEKVMYGTGLRSNILLIPRHYVLEIKQRILEGCKIFGEYQNNPQLRRELKLTEKDFVVSKETDLAYILLSTEFPLFKSLDKFLALDEDFVHPITSQGVLLANPKAGTAGLMKMIDVEIYGVQDKQLIMDQNEKSFEVRDVLVYSYSKAGVCGSLLLRENHQRPIMSMHFAGIGEGITGEGFGIILTRESLAALVDNRTVPVQFEDVAYDTIENAKFVYEDDVFLNYYGSVGPEKTPYLNTKSKIRPSEICNKYGMTTNMGPAILDPKDPRYLHSGTTPLYEGVRKHGLLTKNFDQDLVDRAGDIYWDLYLSKLRPLIADPRELTLDQAVVGIPGMEHYVPMDLSTSAGYPYNLSKDRKKKSDYITVIRNEQDQAIAVDTIDVFLEQELQRKTQLRKQGIVPQTLFIDTLKDEKRKVEKLTKKGGTRVFCSSPVDYVIECRKKFMHFVAAFMDQRSQMCHSVGINPTSKEWSEMTNELLRKNTQFGTIDYANFGAGYNSNVAKKAYELIIRWTMEHVRTLTNDQLDERELWCLVYECLQSMHICNNTVYQQGAGSPSGAFFTTIINTLVNILYLIIAWLKLTAIIMKIKRLLAGIEFKKNVELRCYGDDGVFSVSDEYAEVFNMITIQDFFLEYGIVATDATKTGKAVKFEDISVAQYLKRGFLPHPTRSGQWLSPLVWESVESCAQWVWQSANNKEATYVNAMASLMEAHGHGPIKFKEYKAKLNYALKKAKCKTVEGDWKFFDEIFFDKGFEFDMDQFLLNTVY